MYQSGRIDESRAAALEALRSPVEQERDAGALFIVFNVFYDQFPAALAVLKAALPRLQGDFNTCAAVAYAAWFTDDAELCHRAGQRCIGLNPENALGYLRVGLLALGKRQFVDAFCALSAGRLHCPVDGQINGWYNLAKQLAKGNRKVRFSFDGVEYTFGLAVFNGHAMETAAQHVTGMLCEPEELRLVRKLVLQCDTVVEVGALVGNHTMFFAKTLRPKKVYVFDAYAPAVEQLKENVALNGLDQGGTTVTVRHAAVAAKAGHMRIFDQEVDVVCLDDEVKEKVDFIKIDVDGMEMEVLEGCRGLIARDRPKMMIEVQRGLKDRFRAFAEQYGYSIVGEIGRQADTNFFLVPK